MKIAWILLQRERERGILKHNMTYEGIAERTDLSMIYFPAGDKNRVDQLWAFCRILSTIDVEMSLLKRPKFSGSPMYFLAPPSWFIRRMRFTITLLEPGIFPAKVIDDFDNGSPCLNPRERTTLPWGTPLMRKE